MSYSGSVSDVGTATFKALLLDIGVLQHHAGVGQHWLLTLQHGRRENTDL